MFRIMLIAVLSIIGLVLLVVLSAYLFVTFNPKIGGLPKGEALERIEASPNYDGEVFINNVPTSLDWTFEKMVKIARLQFFGDKKNHTPDHLLPQEDFAKKDLEITEDTNMRLRWFGHSAFYLEMEGKRILLDPMLGDRCAPVDFAGPKRFNTKLPIDIDSIPAIDVVLYSHDHYDHLDYHSVMKLKDRVSLWLVPLGLDARLLSWGVDPDKVKSFDWWEDLSLGSMRFTATPARHFSGRGIGDQYKTFWCSWVIEGQRQKLFFSGDGGYSKNFKEIGGRFGPFDLCLIECGAYNENWADIHMMPEESAQACVDLKGKQMMPIHWGAFNLALHEWNDPVIRVRRKAEELDVKVINPIIGEEIVVPLDFGVDREWWKP